MKNLTLLLFCLTSVFSIGQEMPRDLLDANVAFIYDPSISQENYGETMREYCETIIKSGYNLAGKYLYSDTQTSLMEIEMDIVNKKISYVFLLVDVPDKKTSHNLFLYKIGSENQNLVNPKVGLHTFDSQSTSSLTREIDKIARETRGYNIDTVKYNQKLLNTFVLKKQNLSILKKINEINSVIDGSFLQIEHDTIPLDLAKEKVAFIGASKDEYKAYHTVNSYFSNRMTDYPYDYTYFNSYKDYKLAGGDKVFKYRIQVCNKDTTFYNELKESIKYVHAIEDLETESPKPDFSDIPNNIPRDHFCLVIKNNQTQERHRASTYDHLGSSIRNFTQKFKR